MSRRTRLLRNFIITLFFAGFATSAPAAAAADAPWRADPAVVERLSKSRPDVVYDEAKVPAYELPETLLMRDGTRVTSANQWPKRRAEIVELFTEQMFGRAPGKPEEVRFETVEEKSDALAGRATMMRIAIVSQQGERSHRFELTLYIPNIGDPARKPAFLFIDNRNTPTTAATAATRPTTQNAEYWPFEHMVGRGYAMASFKNGDVAPDDPEKFRDGVMKLFADERSTPTTRPADAWGALAAWAWGASRAMDYLETDPRIDAERVAVVGHSRGGKAALWAGTSDERFALVVSNNSGCGGAAIERRRFGETIAVITQKFPHWFAGNFSSFANRENEMPFDSNMLLSLIAPRGLYVTSSADDLWADPRGEFLGLAHSSPAYALFGAPPIADDMMPPVEQPLIAGTRAYHVRSGGHNLKLYDWLRFADFADAIFK